MCMYAEPPTYRGQSVTFYAQCFKKIWGVSNAISECLLYIWIHLLHSWLFTAGTISGEEIPIVSKTSIKEYRDSFSCEKFSFHSNPNITFYVYVSNFSWPIKIQVRTHFDWFGFYLNTPLWNGNPQKQMFLKGSEAPWYGNQFFIYALG